MKSEQVTGLHLNVLLLLFCVLITTYKLLLVS